MNHEIIEKICHAYKLNNEIGFVLEDHTESLRVFGINNAVNSTFPDIERCFSNSI